MAETAVAIYWDFENVHACLIDDGAGEQTYRSTARYRSQEVVVDVARVVDYAAGFGRITVHRAYANWQYFGKYAAQLQAHAIDLVQLFPLTSTKNGADIRLALDVIDDLRLHPQITHVIVVGSDSDYTALAQRCRTYGVQFVGVGTARTAVSYPAACDAFRRYHELPPTPRFVAAVLPAPTPVSGAAAASLGGAADVVERAIRRVAAETGATSPWALKAAVRPMVKRIDPGFEESAFGFAAFSDLVKALDARIIERRGTFDHELAVRADVTGDGPAALADAALADAALADAALAGAVGPSAALVPADPFAPATAAALIEGLLKRKKQRLPADRQLLWTGPGLIAEIFAAAPDRIVASFDRLQADLEKAGAAVGIAVPESEFRKLKAILWRAHAFEPLGYALGLRLQEPDAATLRLRAVAMLLRLLPDPAGEDRRALAEALFGPAATAEQRDLISAALQKLAERPGAGADETEADSADGTGEPTGWESAA
jgi:NYN domain